MTKLPVPLSHINNFCLTDAINMSFNRHKVYNLLEGNKVFKVNLRRIFSKLKLDKLETSM